jgi:hypothetical protein
VSFSPYAPPAYEPPPAGTGRPGVVIWARIYAIAYALLYLAALVGGCALLADSGDLHGREADDLMTSGVALIAISLPFLAFALVVSSAPRTKWGWIVNVVLMGLSASSCLCLPAAIPLIIFWLKPETKRWYGMEG